MTRTRQHAATQDSPVGHEVIDAMLDDYEAGLDFQDNGPYDPDPGEMTLHGWPSPAIVGAGADAFA